MKFIRGTTPSIDISVKPDIDFHQVTNVWVYISQQGKVKVDKLISDVTFDYEHRKMLVKLSQDDSLRLKQGEALFQIRILMNDGTALATEASRIEVEEIYKEGVIAEE